MSARRDPSPADLASGERAALVEQHLTLVRHLAGRMVAAAFPYLEVEDLVAVGVEALLRASSRYDHGRGVPFATFAYPRVRGAMWESIGAVGPFSRGISRRRAGRPAQRASPLLRGLDELHGDPLAACIDAADRIHLAIDTARLCPQLREAVDALDERDRQIIERHYFAGESLLEIGRDMGRSRSWASRAHSCALARLRAALEPAALHPARPAMATAAPS
ncbi:MAG TPA: sigma-70 family RNA polymerase sigma factor [Kofleriaceae bacterium]|nr:sigma-70 family RNA polymerase sigma factor [Kofleriaceae bacterium]